MSGTGCGIVVDVVVAAVVVVMITTSSKKKNSDSHKNYISRLIEFTLSFFGVPHLATCIFLIFYNEPELGAEIIGIPVGNHYGRSYFNRK